MVDKFNNRLGIDTPVYAFTHCRDVVVAVGKNGGLGCLGSAYMTREELKKSLDWIDENIGDYSYGVDILFNPRPVVAGEVKYSESVDDIVWSRISQEHRQFAEHLLRQAGVPEWPEIERAGLRGMAYESAVDLLNEALLHPKCKLIVSAMGTPPTEIIEKVKNSGKLIGALSGSKQHALAHKAAGLDFVIANGHEGGGHVGSIGSIVLWPEIIKAVAPLPVLAAGGIVTGAQVLAALSLGAEGVWTGSLWLTVAEADIENAQRESYLRASTADTVVTRAWSGKTARVLRNEWTEAWEGPRSPGILQNPDQWLLSADARRRTVRYADSGNAQSVSFSGAGQGIGLIQEIETCRGVMERLNREMLEAYEQLLRRMPQSS